MFLKPHGLVKPVNVYPSAAVDHRLTECREFARTIVEVPAAEAANLTTTTISATGSQTRQVPDFRDTVPAPRLDARNMFFNVVWLRSDWGTRRPRIQNSAAANALIVSHHFMLRQRHKPHCISCTSIGPKRRRRLGEKIQRRLFTTVTHMACSNMFLFKPLARKHE